MDLADMHDLSRYNKHFRYILCVVDVYSRYAFAKLLKNKNANNVARKFEAIMLQSNERPKKVQCDEGGEFQLIRSQLSKQYNFRIFNTYNRDIKAAHVERFIQTLKQMIQRTITVTNSYNYERFLPIIVARYNELPHRSLYGLSPQQVYTQGVHLNKKKHLKQILNSNLKNKTKQVLREGTKVPIARIKNSVFEKSSLQRWVDEQFVIDKVLLYDPVVYKLRDTKGEDISGIFYREELQPIRK